VSPLPDFESSGRGGGRNEGEKGPEGGHEERRESLGELSRCRFFSTFEA